MIGRRKLIRLLGSAAAWPLAARAAARANAPHRRAHEPYGRRCGGTGASRGIHAGASGGGLERRPQRARRSPLGWRRPRALSQPCGGIGRPCARCLSLRRRHRHAGAAKGYPKHTDRVRECRRPGRHGLRREPSATGRQCTGFTVFEFSMGGKWLELLKQIAPGITRAAVLRDASLASGAGEFGAVQTVAPSFGVELHPVDVRDADEMDRAITAFASESNGGLIVPQTATPILHRNLIIPLAPRHRLPAISAYSSFATDGGLISYGPDSMDGYRRATGYVDRILKGAKPADLPVQAPVKYELVINLKTAKALGLEVPPSVLARATEVIE